jgi:ABC-type dipeptide/oligopeptide/nickel transport system ATPase subunit
VDTASGGSVRAVIDLITRVFLIKQTGKRKFLCMDESLSMISDLYIQPVVDFLNSLAKEMDFDFLMITHDPRFKEYGESVYQIDKGTVDKIK